MSPLVVPPTLARALPWGALALLLTTSQLANADAPLADDTPRGTYVWVPEDASSAPRPAAGGAPHIIYLNRCEGGLTVTSGWPDDNTVDRSGILPGTVNFPEFSHGDMAWDAVVAETREIFSPFNITITDVDPSPMPHDEAVVCGSGGQAGFGGAGGVAPFTCGVIDAPITFTFPDSLGGHPRTIAEVIAQEAAHAWGLEHEYKCEDPMTYLSGCGEKTFQQGDYPCGEYQAVSCQCGGATQNSFQYIEELFGPAVEDLAPPSLAIVTPADGDVYAVGETFDISIDVADDVGVTYVALYLDGELATEALAEPFGPWPVIDLPQGSHELYVEARDAAANSSTSDVVTIEVTPDGAPPPDPGGDAGEDGGDDGGDDDGGASGGDGAGGDDGGDGDAGGDAGQIPSLPDDFGSPNDEGCACGVGDRDNPRWAWSALVLMGLACARRRRRHG